MKQNQIYGRNQELTLLNERWKLSLESKGQVVLISGPPGIGKSHLAHFFANEKSPAKIIAFRCSSQQSGNPFHPIIDFLQQETTVRTTDNQDVRLEKLKALLQKIGFTGMDRLVLLGKLLAAAAATTAPLPPPAALKSQIISVIVAMIEALCKQDPAIILVEDSQWIDSVSSEWLQAMIQRLADKKIMIIATARTEYIPKWLTAANVARTELKGLDLEATKQLARALAGENMLVAEIENKIFETSGGVPLLVEELALMMSEAQSSTTALSAASEDARHAIGANVLTRLSSRQETKELAEMCSIIGQHIDESMLAVFCDESLDHLLKRIDGLVENGILLKEISGFSFKNSLIRDSIYESIEKSRRQKLHEKLVLKIETQMPELILTNPDLIANHCSLAGLGEKAYVYFRRAGEQASRSAALLEAIRNYQKSLEIIRGLDASTEHMQAEASILTQLGPCLSIVKGWSSPEVEPIYKRAEELAIKLGSSADVVSPLSGLWLYHAARCNYPAALKISERIFKIAEDLKRSDFVMQGHHAAWPTFLALGELKKAQVHIDNGLALYDEKAHKHHATTYMGHDPAVCGHVLGGLLHCLLAAPEKSNSHVEEGLALAKRSGHPPTLVHAYFIIGVVRMLQEDVDAAIAVGDDLFNLAEALKLLLHRPIALFIKGWAIAKTDLNQGLASMTTGLEAYRNLGTSAYLPFFLSLVAENKAAAGRPDEAWNMLSEASDILEVTAEKWFEPGLYYAKGVHWYKYNGSGNLQDSKKISLDYLNKGLNSAQSASSALFERKINTFIQSLK